MTMNPSPASTTTLAERAHNIRRHALRMGQVQGQGYVGQALGAADLLAVSYFHALNHKPEDPEWEQRDRFYLSIGHYAIALYAALIEAEIIPLDELETYGSDDSRLPMSGMAAYTPGMEITGGSLGHGLGIAVGACLGLKRKKSASWVYNLLSDGELLIKGKKVTGFSNEEEQLAGLAEFVPYLTETELVKRGALYEKASEPWAAYAIADGRLITGQNPASGGPVADLVLEALK